MSAAKTPAPRTPRQAKVPDGEICLLLFSQEKGQIAAIDLTGEEFAKLQQRARKLKTSLDQMLTEGVLQMINTEKLNAVLGPCLQAPSSKSEVAS